MDNTQPAPVESLTFEQAFEELDNIIAQLESGELSLEESVEVYERGRKLSAHCQSLLEKAELRISQLDAQGGIKPL